MRKRKRKRKGSEIRSDLGCSGATKVIIGSIEAALKWWSVPALAVAVERAKWAKKKKEKKKKEKKKKKAKKRKTGKRKQQQQQPNQKRHTNACKQSDINSLVIYLLYDDQLCDSPTTIY